MTTTDDEGLKYSDNKWHHFVAKRVGTEGRLLLNDKWTGNNRSFTVKIDLISAASLLLWLRILKLALLKIIQAALTLKSEDFKP